MSPEEMHSVGPQLVEVVMNQGNVAAVDQFFAPDSRQYGLPAGVPPTRDGLKMALAGLRAAFPDIHNHIDEEIVEGDKMVHRLTAHATMTGEFMGMSPTGKHGTWTEIHIARIAGGQVAEHWTYVDQMGMMQQLGLAPMPAQPAA